jgi:hypothetical protein
MIAWGKPEPPGSTVAFTRDSWIAEHVWIGVLGALLAVVGVVGLVIDGELEYGFGPLLGWPAITWAVGSDYTGYALRHAAWISGEIWLGVLVAYAVAVFAAMARWRFDLSWPRRRPSRLAAPQPHDENDH